MYFQILFLQPMMISEMFLQFLICVQNTGVARNFDGRPMEKFCGISLLTFFGDVITMTSLK